MKKTLTGLFILSFILTFPVFGQAVEWNQYKAIDPFDYKIDELKAAQGQERKFKSVVQFESRSGQVMLFYSIDYHTSLNLIIKKDIKQPALNQKVTIYYTALKKVKDELILDDIDYDNTTEEGIGLVKSRVSPSTDIDRSSYKEIDLFDYKNEAETARQGEARKYKSPALFSSQSGTNYAFVSSTDEGKTLVILKTNKRYPSLNENQGVVIYYTAVKGIVDSLTLDDIVF
jgi:sporulation protein YlmC with PRC-barrel domain